MKFFFLILFTVLSFVLANCQTSKVTENPFQRGWGTGVFAGGLLH